MYRGNGMSCISTSMRRRRIEPCCDRLPFRAPCERSNEISLQDSQVALNDKQVDNLLHIRHDVDRIIPTSHLNPPSRLPAFARIINMFVRAPIRWVALGLFTL